MNSTAASPTPRRRIGAAGALLALAGATIAPTGVAPSAWAAPGDNSTATRWMNPLVPAADGFGYMVRVQPHYPSSPSNPAPEEPLSDSVMTETQLRGYVQLHVIKLMRTMGDTSWPVLAWKKNRSLVLPSATNNAFNLYGDISLPKFFGYDTPPTVTQIRKKAAQAGWATQDEVTRDGGDGGAFHLWGGVAADSLPIPPGARKNPLLHHHEHWL